MSLPEPERPFNAPWEAEAFALVVRLHEKGAFTWVEWAAGLGATIKDHPERPYYENWLSALEKIVEQKGLMTGAERQSRIKAWDNAARATPHGQPVLLQNASPVFDFKPI